MMINIKYILLAGLVTNLLLTAVFAKDIYQQPDDFLSETFSGDVPKVSKLWIQKPLQEQITTILGHELGSLRLSYWQRQNRTAWILEEIGKSLPITVGIVINDNRVETLRILIFRESRGWEVRYPFFTDQFIDAMLNNASELDKGIDGISGATLSVNAVKRLAALALLFHKQVSE